MKAEYKHDKRKDAILKDGHTMFLQDAVRELNSLVNVDSSIVIEKGESNRDFRIGDFLNAIDEVVCYFQEKSCEDNEFLARAMELYAKRLKEL